MALPKVLIFTPIYDGKEYCLKEFLHYVRKINYPNYRHIFIDNSKDISFFIKLKRMGLDVYRVDRGANSREALARAQNRARKIAIEENYDYMFSLESDIYVPADIIQRLMLHAKPVISALYFIGNNKNVPCITLPYFDEQINAWGTKLVPPDEVLQYVKQGVKRVQAGGFGTTLIRRDIFTQVAFTYDIRFKGHSDIYFFNWCFNKQIPVFVDTDIMCQHDNSDWSKVKDR